MLDVLSFVYDHYWHRAVCPELPALHRKLCTADFASHDIQAALHWLEDLKSATHHWPANDHTARTASTPPGARCASDAAASSMRLLSPAEQTHLGQDSWGYVLFLIEAGALPAQRLELVLDRLLAIPGGPISVDDLKLVLLMVFWSLGEEPSALVLDELCEAPTGRTRH